MEKIAYGFKNLVKHLVQLLRNVKKPEYSEKPILVGNVRYFTDFCTQFQIRKTRTDKSCNHTKSDRLFTQVRKLVPSDVFGKKK